MPTKTAVLKLNGKPLELNAPSPAMLKVLAFLDKAPPDELFTAEELSQRCGVTFNYVRDLCRKAAAETYSQIVGHRKMYGNPKAVTELRRQLESR